MPASGQDRRRSPRWLCSHLVEVRWRGESHHGLLEDLSPEGAAVAVEASIQQGATIELVAGAIRAPAEVRSCLQRETDYRLGLEFTGGFRWDRQEWQPEHCFLPPGS